MDVFQQLAPYIQDYIYRERWEELREVQIAACQVIFQTQDNLLLSTGTASGKTEAAFLPALTMLDREPSRSVGILYVSPLKALINDQFYRLEHLLEEGNVPVCKWHGDASRAAKDRLLKEPRGVLQITPESLESLLINRQNSCVSLFCDLRYIIVDEVHYFMGNSRGTQLLCLLERIQRTAGVVPRRIGLSATLGDPNLAEKWLNSGTGRSCRTPRVPGGKKQIRIAMERFLLRGDSSQEEMDSGKKTHFQYLYRNTLDKKSIIFSNSRSEAEFVIANLKEMAAEGHRKDVYRIHHGSVASLLREETEKEMKESTDPIVTGATVTLELGIDIGSLDRVVQIGAPFTVSSFAQRLGRCGRRGQPAELLFTFEDAGKTGTDPFGEINWEFLRTAAIIQLYLEEQWVEPIEAPQYPYELLFHQTMAFLKANGEVHPALLAQKILSLSPFRGISQEDYRLLLRHLIRLDQIEKTERDGLIVGLAGERLVNHYGFYAVFEAPAEYLVKSGNESIGTVQDAIPKGMRFALAGRSWECVEVHEKSKTIFVKKIGGIAKTGWVNSGFEVVDTKVLRKMRQILLSEQQFSYMSAGCREKLQRMRAFAARSGFGGQMVTAVGRGSFAIFPWVGTRQLFALRFALEEKGAEVDGLHSTNYYLVAEDPAGKRGLEEAIYQISQESMDKYSFRLPEKMELPNKYREFIPEALRRKECIGDFIDLAGLQRDLQNLQESCK